jgi:hypothetical protein
MLSLTRNAAKSTLLKMLILSSIWILASLLLLVIGDRYGREIEINWQTETEYNTAGYNIYRSDRPDEGYTKINDLLIAAEGNATTGANYSFIDKDVPADAEFFYRLEDIEYDGEKKSHPPIAAKSPGAPSTVQLLALSSGLIGVSLLILGIRTYKVAEHHGTN